MRGLVALATAALVIAFGAPAGGATSPAGNFSPTPDLPCLGASDRPESIQGRVPLADFTSGRAALGYTCNATMVSHVGIAGKGVASQGGYRVHRYVDHQNHVCAFYDTSLFFPANLQAAPADTGVWVLDMADPANPVHTATLRTLAMQSPHESLSLNADRGLLGAVFSSPVTQPGQFDLYDVSQDCLHPTLAASLPMGILGHEGSFAPDGNTYYATSLFTHTLTAIDTSNILAPRALFVAQSWGIHGLNLSDDGNYLYAADLGNHGTPFGSSTSGLTVLDVSKIQSRALVPSITQVSHLTWPHISTPQTNLPVTIGGHKYLIEVDEFGSGDAIGAGRIINIDNLAAPVVVSNLRLAVHNADHYNDGSQAKDPNPMGALQGYAGHYCGVPQEIEPGIVACSMILSGLRVFDIRDPLNPVEIAYFNQPSTVSNNPLTGPPAAYAMSQPVVDAPNHNIWYTDGNSGFYSVHVASPSWP